MSALGRPNRRRILIAYATNELGTWFGYVALSISVYDHTRSAVAVAALLVSARLVPALVLPALVARVEASPRRSTLSSLYLIEGAAAIALAFLLWHFSLAGVLLLSAIDGVAALAATALMRTAVARTDPGKATATAAETRDEEEVEITRRRANAAMNAVWTATIALGPALAGVAVGSVGAPTAMLIDAGSFVICAALLVDLAVHVDEDSGDSVRKRLGLAWQHLRAAPQLRALLITEAIAIVFFTLIEPVEVVFAKATLHAGDTGFGALVAVWGGGMLIGSAIFARALRQPLGPLLALSTLVVAIADLGFGAAPTLGAACLAALFGGVGNGVQWASLISAVQQMTPEALHGRLMGAVGSIGALCPALGFSMGGALGALTSPRPAMFAAGAGATACAIVFVRLWRGSRVLSGVRALPQPADTQTATS